MAAPAGTNRKSRIGSVYLQVMPSMDGFFKEINKNLNSKSKDIGMKLGADIGNQINDSMNGALAKKMKGAGGSKLFIAPGRKGASAFTNAFDRDLKSHQNKTRRSGAALGIAASAGISKAMSVVKKPGSVPIFAALGKDFTNTKNNFKRSATETLAGLALVKKGIKSYDASGRKTIPFKHEAENAYKLKKAIDSSGTSAGKFKKNFAALYGAADDKKYVSSLSGAFKKISAESLNLNNTFSTTKKGLGGLKDTFLLSGMIFADQFKPKNWFQPSQWSNSFKGIGNVSASAFKGAFTGLKFGAGVFSSLITVAGPIAGRLASMIGGGIQKAINAVKMTALTAAGAAVIAGGAIIKGGLGRALGIEDAEAKLTGLGYKMKDVTSIRDDVLRSVKGTAYSLDETMSVAASALAAGIPKGEGLETYLRTIADTATISGASIGEIGPIFNKAMSQGKVTTEVMNQLADRGIPIYQWLAKETGYSMEVIQKALSKGEVGTIEFRNAIVKNIGGAAKDSGKTTRGAMKNTMAAFNRLGAAAAGGSLPIIRGGLNSIMPVIDALTDRVNKLAPAFWETFGEKALPAMAEFSKKAIEFINSGGLEKFFTSVSEKAGMLRDIFVKVFEVISNSPIATVIKTIIDSFSKIDAGGGLAVLIGLFEQIQAIAGPIFEQISTTITATLAPALDIILPALIEVIQYIGEGLGIILPTILPILTDVFNVIAEALLLLMPILANAIGMILNSLGPTLLVLAEVLGPVLSVVFGLVSEVIKALVPIIAMLLEALAPLIAILLEVLQPILLGLAGVIQYVVAPILYFLIDVVKNILTTISAVILAVAIGVVSFWNFIADRLNAISVDPPQWMKDFLGIDGAIGFRVPTMEVPSFPQLYTGGNIAGSKDGTLAILGDRNKPETVTDLGLTNKTMAATLALTEKAMQTEVNNKGSLTIINNIEAPEGMSTEELAQKINIISRRNERRG